MAEIITIADKWRLRRIDKLNLVLEEYRLPNETNANRGKVGTEYDWYPAGGVRGCGPFFANVGDALAWLLNRRMVEDPGEITSIGAAVAEMHRIAEDLRHVKVER